MHRLPHQVPDQARRRLPPGPHRRPARARRTAGRRAAVRAVLADLRELAALRRPAQEPPAGPAARALQGQSPPPRTPRLRRAPRPGLPQMVRQDPRRSPRRPAPLAPRQPSASPRPTRPATPGNPSPPATPTTCPTPSGCCTSSPTGNAGTPHSPKPGPEPAARPRIFRQLGGRHDQPQRKAPTDRLLTVAEAADERISTSARFIRRLIAERRIAFVKLGRHVRHRPNPTSLEFIEAGRIASLNAAAMSGTTRRSRVMANKDGHRRFGSIRTAAVRPVPDPLSGPGRPVADRRRHLLEQASG